MKLQIATLDPTELLKCLSKTGDVVSLGRGIGLSTKEHRPNAPYATIGQLRVRGERRRCHRAANKPDELPPPHSITSSASARSVGGTSSPIALAILRLITSSNLVGNCTGNSLILVPCNIWST